MKSCRCQTVNPLPPLREHAYTEPLHTTLTLIQSLILSVKKQACFSFFFLIPLSSYCLFEARWEWRLWMSDRVKTTHMKVRTQQRRFLLSGGFNLILPQCNKNCCKPPALPWQYYCLVQNIVNINVCVILIYSIHRPQSLSFPRYFDLSCTRVKKEKPFI